MASTRVGGRSVHAVLHTPTGVNCPGCAVAIPVPRRNRQEIGYVPWPVIDFWVRPHKDTVHHLVHDISLWAEEDCPEIRVVVTFEGLQGGRHQVMRLLKLQGYNSAQGLTVSQLHRMPLGHRHCVIGLGCPQIGREEAIGVFILIQAGSESGAHVGSDIWVLGRPCEHLTRINVLGRGRWDGVFVRPVHHRIISLACHVLL